MNRTFAALGPTIFDVVSRRAQALDAINLGQGFPEEDGPLALREAAARAITEGPNQYPPMRGIPALREAIARHYERFAPIELDWKTEVAVTSGATEAIAAALLAVVESGDEVIAFEPTYDAYRPLIERAGGIVRTVRLAPPDKEAATWRIPPGALEAACNPRTKAILVNTPTNPAASIMTEHDIARIEAVCEDRDLIAISDEVWEHITFDGALHTTLLARPGLRERTIKIGSAGKMFGFTGWKVGFVCASPPLLDAVVKAHQFLTFTTPPHLQTAAAVGLDYADDYFLAQRAALTRSRDRLEATLRAGGFQTLPTSGAYFLNVDLNASGIALDDAAFCLHALDHCAVAAIPLSAFYGVDPLRHLVRLCFAKRDETLDRGAERLIQARRMLT